MVSKCANPACSELFRYLHEGKIFHLCPTPQVEEATEGFAPSLYERFWLCDRCSKIMTLVWGGTEVKLVPLPKQHSPSPSPGVEETGRETEAKRRRRTAVALE